MNNYAFLSLKKLIIHVENFIPTKCLCTITWQKLIFIILLDMLFLHFEFWVIYPGISLEEEVSYVLCDCYKSVIFNPTFGFKTSTTNGGKACGHLPRMSAYQTRSCNCIQPFTQRSTMPFMQLPTMEPSMEQFMQPPMQPYMQPPTMQPFMQLPMQLHMQFTPEIYQSFTILHTILFSL